MIKALSILVLLLVSLPQRNAVVIPTKLTVDPIPFRKGALISIHASFGQVAESKCPSPSPIFKDLSDGFGIKIYDAKDVPTEPSDMLGKETKYIASTTATVNPTDDDNAKKVERDFESVKIPENAPGRIYVVVWRECTWNELVDPTTNPPTYKPGKKPTQLGGGKFFKFECSEGGTPRRPTGLCAYRPE
jgi:hypothetical protein